MNKRLMGVLLVVVLLAGTMVAACTAKSPGRATVHLNGLCSPLGGLDLEEGLAIDDLLSKHHPWLRYSPMETQGGIYNLSVMINDPVRSKDTIFLTDPSSQWMAKNKMDPFKDGFKAMQPKALLNLAWCTWLVVTENPGINGPQYLAGKRVVSGPTAGTANMVWESILKAAGVHSKLSSLQHVGFGQVSGVLLDHLADVGIVATYLNTATWERVDGPALFELMASGRSFHFVGGFKPMVEQVIRDGMPTKEVSIPAKTFAKQEQALDVFANPLIHGVDATFPEEYAYEYIKTILGNIKELNTYGGLAKILTPEFMTYDLGDQLHPGARKAYQEKGLLK